MSANSYLDPPEEPEQQTCDDCGHDMRNANANFMHIRHMSADWECPNPDCPSKFEEGSNARRLAELVLDQADIIERLMRKIRGLTINEPKEK